MDEIYKLGDDDQSDIYTAIYDCYVVEGFVYCNITIIGYGYKKNYFIIIKQMDIENLS